MQKPVTTDQYIAQFPKVIQALLLQARDIIKKAAPQAEEVISYGMPAFRQQGMLVYYAAWKSHIGLYPASSATFKKFEKELAAYTTSEGAIQFSYEKKLPIRLVTAIVKFRVKENLEKAVLKKKK
ncbi:MAG: DUF1801 domain-containing protein [Chitinophagaceae bacterium]|nr:DUF1801 domain-containing protein [Chitinophagaceae bacterium]